MTTATRLILVGGFLGAGKTTLLGRAAARLTDQGKRVALLVNDQAGDLVDTAALQETGSAVDEVTGGCFCCRFPDLVGALERLCRQAEPDVVFAEPVGSCTDLSATVLQPLKQMYGRQFRLAPFSVLVDVRQLGALLRLERQSGAGQGTGFPADVWYIYRKQLEEADLIVLNKTDLVSPGELAELRDVLGGQFPDTPLLAISALHGDGVNEWLEWICQDRPAGRKIAEVDYPRYTAGEAALGWMNASARLRSPQCVDWEGFVRRLLETVQAELRAAGGQIAHLKLYLTTAGRGHLAANLTANDEMPLLRGTIEPSAGQARLLVNARVHIRPEPLRTIVEHCLQEAAGGQVEVTLQSLRSFFPARPVPTHRFTAVVDPPTISTTEL